MPTAVWKFIRNIGTSLAVCILYLDYLGSQDCVSSFRRCFCQQTAGQRKIWRFPWQFLASRGQDCAPHITV
jgi:hypothetical protein